MSESSGHVPAGWYPDPSGERQWRVWNGTAWSNVTRPYGAPVVSAPTTLGVDDLETLSTIRRLTHFGVLTYYGGFALIVSIANHWPGHAHAVSARVASALLGVAIGLALIGAISFAMSVRALRGRWTLEALVPVVNTFACASLMSTRLGIANSSFRLFLDAVITAGFVVLSASNPWFGLFLAVVAANQLVRAGALVDLLSGAAISRPVAS